jgi:hypothetical protein
MVSLALCARTPAEAQTTSTRVARETRDLGEQSSTCRASFLVRERLRGERNGSRSVVAGSRDQRPRLFETAAWTWQGSANADGAAGLRLWWYQRVGSSC